MNQHPPRPATDLFPEALKLSPKQRLVLDTLANYPDGSRVYELAEELNMHANTIRGHLDELTERGAVHSFTAPAIGRGRPSLIYKVRIPDNRTVAAEYVTLIEVMGDYLEEQAATPEESAAMAQAIGKRWGEKLRERGLENPESSQGFLGRITAYLRSMGFDPIQEVSTEDGTSISMRSCPLSSNEFHPTPFICAVHEGTLQQLLDDDRMHLNLVPYDQPGQCCVEITRKQA
ncbi:helix-turn-helix transcriptional regulator [Corynebacterium pelargi]|uniref:Uncharacterized protein n=1 Tax=Corynebacterium pelargi TaxID=1471400 RepID=A0A410W9H1_9CORY|nr:helix-turn-helix domain-containing protein [Corynebacterium pelargi]QAU52604.1 hypothetical protein CPELA_06705 [Corynebacterium pelargi]GGG77621.1 hypothetical protein GCM10007338_14340 [Corynebacterium pelargi]